MKRLTVLPCKKLFEYLAGGIFCIIFCLFIIFSIPIYIYRMVVVSLAKKFRPDLASPLNALSNMLVHDLFSAKSPRANCLAIFILKGHWNKEKFTRLVEDRWIKQIGQTTGNHHHPTYQKFQQYPYRWLGFTFWKHAGNKFDITQHVIYHKYGDDFVTRDRLDAISEQLLNEGFQSETSPWELHYVSNYVDSNIGVSSSDTQHFALILKFHHCLADGLSIRSAMIEGLAGQPLNKFNLPLSQPPKTTLKGQLVNIFNFTMGIAFVISNGFSKTFKNCPWKIKDVEKSWSQHYGRSDPIDILWIKDIKNGFGVSFSSVLLSAISYAIHKDLESRKIFNDGSMPCMSVLPVADHSLRLTNAATATIFNIPTVCYPDQISRLKECEVQLQKTKQARVPHLLRLYQGVVGWHLHCVSKLFSKNRWISTGLTNFAMTSTKLALLDSEIISAEIAVGALQGDQGVLFTATSYGDHVCITATAEKSLLSKIQVQNILTHVREEINALHKLVEV